MSRKPTPPIHEAILNEPSPFPSATTTSNLQLNIGDGISESTFVGGLNLEHVSHFEEERQSQASIDVLPDNILLEVFHLYKENPPREEGLPFPIASAQSWIKLIHVCQRWRHIIFGSPRRLDLRLVCSHKTPITMLLDIWPPFPIILWSFYEILDEEGLENIMAALRLCDRISSIYINSPIDDSASEKWTSVIHEPFPVLTECYLFATNNSVSVPVLPDTFLGGSAPQLESFQLQGIPFPTSPNFVLSSTQIRSLHLQDIPDSGYISPEVMTTCLATLPQLRFLSIGFRSPLFRHVQRTEPPTTRAVFPVLSYLSFCGVNEYLEDFLAQIHAPRLNIFSVTFFMDLIFDIPQLCDMIIGLIGKANHANMEFTSRKVKIVFTSQNNSELGIKCERLDWQLSSMTQIFSQSPFLVHVENFVLCESHYSLDPPIGWEDDPDMDPSQWLELFRLLISVQHLYVSERLVHRVAATLKELTGEMAMEVFPALRNLSLEGLEPSGPVQDDLKSFVAARQLADHPIVIQRWELDCSDDS